MTALLTVAELVRQRTGIVIPAARTAALQAALHRAAPGMDPAAFLRAAADPATGPDLMGRLIDEVTVKETSFVRDAGQLGTIPWRALRRGAASTVRVWSAGCATGEEAYSLALLAAESLAPGPASVDVLGTDISGAALAAARTGCYRERAVRGLDPSLRRRYLERQPDGTYLVGEKLRGLVRFRRHNLAAGPAPPPGERAFDLVLCRNVLIYFDQALATRLAGLLRRSLIPGGMLMLGAADAITLITGPGGTAPPPKARRPRPRRVPAVTPSREERLAAALQAAGRGDRDAALAKVTSLLAEDPLDAEAHFVHGLVTLEAGDPARATAALRRTLYTDPGNALAAFTLGRAYDALGDVAAARRAYSRALLSLDPCDKRHEPLLQQIDLADIAAACRARLKGHP